jgi:hypothetical protein
LVRTEDELIEMTGNPDIHGKAEALLFNVLNLPTPPYATKPPIRVHGTQRLKIALDLMNFRRGLSRVWVRIEDTLIDMAGNPCARENPDFQHLEPSLATVCTQASKQGGRDPKLVSCVGLLSTSERSKTCFE